MCVCVLSVSIHYIQVYKLYREPLPEARPDFPSLFLKLQRPDFKLLTWVAEDVAAYTEEARTLGAPLEAREQLYTDIQSHFTNTSA